MDNDNFLDQYLNVNEINDGDDFEAIEHTSFFNDDDTIKPEESGIKPEEGNQNKPQVTSIITELLKEKGITDPSQIKFENEEGEEERISFYDLPVEEQLEIIRSNSNTQDELDDTEISFINYLRQNQLTPEEVIDYAKKQAIQEYLANQLPLESVESLTDDEIFVTDLLTRIKDITDDEAQEALDLEKQNETLFKKKVDSLRADLLEKEKLRKQEEDVIAEEEKQQSFEAFKQSLFDTAPNVKEIAGRIELDDKDINDTVDFLLAEDANGTRFIAKALNDPESLIKMAWFNLKGEEAINEIAEYYESQIKAQSKSNYEKGYEDGKKGIVPTTRVAIKSKDEKPNVHPFMNIPQNPALIKK